MLFDGADAKTNGTRPAKLEARSGKRDLDGTCAPQDVGLPERVHGVGTYLGRYSKPCTVNCWHRSGEC